MIPILYDKNETAFTGNGLGRLRDCIDCVVYEERNSIYECSFSYPTTGAHFDEIIIGRIIGVTHDESGDIEPFDIVKFSRPINGVVTFHCTHISYRLSYMTVTASNVSSLADAFTAFSGAEPSMPFTFDTDKSNVGYLACADGIPRSVRQMMGGIEGSILDAYGGEWSYNNWTVYLHNSRGKFRDFSIRYGVNMLDYTEDYDSQGVYTSCVPYWKGGETIVIGDRVDSGGSTPSGRGECVPLDLSDKFETEPTKAEVEAAALEYMSGNNTFLPGQTIKVEFVRLQDVGELENYRNLLQCNLCDTINVIFPDYNTTGLFKIVKTEWNVLEGRYISMDLGTLSITLAEALGISNSLESSSGGGGGGDAADYIVANSLSGDWIWRKWNSGIVELWTTVTITARTNTSDAGGYVSASAATPANFPFELMAVPVVQVTCDSGGVTGSVTSSARPSTTSAGSWKLYRNSSNTNEANKNFMFYVVGRWK